MSLLIISFSQAQHFYFIGPLLYFIYSNNMTNTHEPVSEVKSNFCKSKIYVFKY